MSRCFPFPPPGYEKKPRPEDPIIVKEEKKEKKHKKEKKEREKREGKEKKDKERSDGKVKEKRDKKEKHKKEKHKDKQDKEEEDRGKDKEKRIISETNGAASILGTKIEDKFGTKDGKNNNFIPNEKNGAAVFHRQNGEQNIQCNLLSRDMENSKFVLELARRINDEEEVTHNQLERLQGDEKKKEDSRFVQELARRIKDEERVTSNQLERLSGAEKKKNDEGERIPVKSLGNFVVDKGKDKDRHIGDRKMDGKRIRDDVKFSENQTVQSFAGTGKSSIGGLPRAAEDNEKRTEGKDKAKEKDDRSRNKHKGKDGEKKSHRKDKDEEKEKKKAEKAKKKKEDKNTEPDKSKNVTRSESTGSKNGQDKSSNVSKSCPVGFTEVMGSVSLSDHQTKNVVEGTEKKRKEMDSNEPVNSSNASRGYPVGFTEVIGSAPLSGQRNHAIVIRNEKKRKEIEANAPECISNATMSFSVDFTEVLGSAPLSDDCINHAIAEGNAKKRKEMDVNGFSCDNEARPNKVRRPSPHQLLENGRKLDASQSPNLFTYENHGGAARSLTVCDKEQRKNGLIEGKSVHILGPNPSVLNDHVTEKSRKTKTPSLEKEHILGSNPSVVNDQVIEKSRKTKPPHPDTEFLSQILTVPRMDEWSCFDDLEWLSGSQDPPSKKPQVGSDSFGQDMQVWCDALTIESADIVALPYVLPY